MSRYLRQGGKWLQEFRKASQSKGDPTTWRSDQALERRGKRLLQKGESPWVTAGQGGRSSVTTLLDGSVAAWALRFKTRNL